MKLNIAFTIVSLILSLALYGLVIDRELPPSSKDSILLARFWYRFKKAVNDEDKNAIASICKFPFYCRPCISDTSVTHKINYNAHTVKVTKNLFEESQYKVFFSNHVKIEINRHKNFDLYIFHRTRNNYDKYDGFEFSYILIEPSNNLSHWTEGAQGFIELKKNNNEYLIDGIDEVP